jgi:hypothetical protein
VTITTGHIIWVQTERVEDMESPQDGPVMMHAVAIVDGTPAQRTTCDRFDVDADHYLINHDFFDPDFIFAAPRCDECKILLNVSPSD